MRRSLPKRTTAYRYREDRHAKLGKSHNSNDFVLFIPVENPCMCKDSILNANLYKLSENRNRFLSKLLTLWL